MIIYILNDENTNKVLSLLKSVHCVRGIEQDIYIFQEVNELLEESVRNTVHVVICSERVGKYSGYDLAYRLRMINKNILPIIIRQDMMIDEKAGQSELFGCISMDKIEDMLPDLIEYSAKRVQQQEKNFVLSYFWNGEERQVEVDSIIYFCSNHRVVEYKGIEGSKGVFYQKLDVVEKLLKENKINFIRIGKSFLVNSKHIVEKNEQELLLVNGEKIIIPRRYVKKIEL